MPSCTSTSATRGASTTRRTTGVDVPGSAQYYSIPAYGLLNGRVTWNFDTHSSKSNLKFSIWAKNLTNKQYQEHIIGQGAAPIVPVPNATTGAEVPQTGYTYQRDRVGAGAAGRSAVVLRFLTLHS